MLKIIPKIIESSTCVIEALAATVCGRYNEKGLEITIRDTIKIAIIAEKELASLTVFDFVEIIIPIEIAVKLIIKDIINSTI